jgi:hypothetical protein
MEPAASMLALIALPLPMFATLPLAMLPLFTVAYAVTERSAVPPVPASFGRENYIRRCF